MDRSSTGSILSKLLRFISFCRFHKNKCHKIQFTEDLLSIASHELKMPITSVRLRLEMLQKLIKEAEVSSQTRDKLVISVESALAQLDRLTELINDLFDVTSISKGQLQLKRSYVDLREILKETINTVSIGSTNGRIQLAADYPIIGYWDKVRVEQIFRNLIENAIKYGEHKPITITLFSEKDIAKVLFQDQGKGISKDNQRKIFGCYERAALSGEVSGLGLGLYIVEQLVKAHGGIVKVKSEPGAGSTFIVELPLIHSQITE